MTDSIRTILSPLLFISYVFGVKIVEFPTGKLRLWLGSLYVLLLWSVYYLLSAYTAYYYVSTHSIIFHVCLRLNIFTAILSTIFGFSYDKKFRNCLKKLTTVDNTLEKLGTMTNYKELHTRVLLVVFGWLTYVVWETFINGIWYTSRYESVKAFYIVFIIHYCTYVNIIDDLIIMCILRYIELKFDQINEYVRKSQKDKKLEIKRTCDEFVFFPRQTGYPKTKNSEYVTWIVMHLHLELRRISRELNSIFSLPMTAKMGRYFAFVSLSFREIFNIILINNYVSKNVMFSTVVVNILVSNLFRLFLFNYMCERISVKASATGDFLNQIPYCSYNVAVRENILQFLLQLTQIPVKFYGLGLFQFGFKFLHGFCSFVATVIVILIQSHTRI